MTDASHPEPVPQTPAPPVFLPPGLYTGSNSGAVVAVGDDQKLLVVRGYPPTVGDVRITDPQTLADLADAIRSLADKRGKALRQQIRPAADPAALAVQDIIDRVRRLISDDALITDVLTEIAEVVRTRGIVL